MQLEIKPEQAQAFISSLKDYDFLASDATEATHLLELAALMKTVQ